MTPTTEMQVQTAATIAGLSGFIGAYVGDNIFTTIIPTLIGTGVHVANRMEAGKLTRRELANAVVVAFCIGFWGGPFAAEEWAESERALPFMCFLFAMWATTLLTALQEWIKRMLGDKNGSN